METELYENICKAKIKESIYCATKIILKDVDNFESLVSTFIAVCSYVGSFVSVYDIRLLVDVCQDIMYLIDDEKIVMKDVYVLVTKLCIICDIYVKNPVAKTGATNVKLLRPKIIDLFTATDTFKLSDNGISLFEGVLPPADSESYSLGMQIITGYVHIIKELEALSTDNHQDKIDQIAQKIRKSFDYIVRKKYTFETKFYKSDNDAVWFLWGILSLLFQDNEMDMFYQMFNYRYCKKNRNHRIGLLWAAGILLVWIKKRDIARGWTSKEVQVIKKIEEVSLDLYKDIKKSLLKSGEIQDDSKELREQNKFNGLEYISNVRYTIQDRTGVSQAGQSAAEKSEDVIKYIKYKK
jgi:hypothetical protein